MLSPSKLKDRVFYGWVVVVVFLVTGTVIWGMRYSFGVFFKSIESEFELTRAVTSVIYSTQMIFCAGFAILAGWALDKYGPRIILFLMGLFTGLGLVLTSQTTSLWQLFITYSLLLAMGISATYVVIMSTVSRWFDKKRGLALGIASSGAGLGTFVLAPFAAYLIAEFDWRMACLIIGLIAWSIVLPLSMLLRRDPYEIGAIPDGAKTGSKSNESEEVKILPGGLSLLQALKTRSFWFFMFCWFLLASNLLLVLTHIVPHATDIGFSAVEAATVLSVIGGANAVGRVLMGLASDKIGRKLAAVICALFMVGTMLWLLWARELWIFYLFALVFGFSWGGMGPVMAALIGETFGLGNMGAILGVLDVGFSAGAAIGPAVGGLIFDVTGSYFLAFLIGAIALFFAVLLTVLVRREVSVNSRSELTR